MRKIFRSGAVYALSQVIERAFTTITFILLFQIASSKFIAHWNSFLLGTGIITSVITIGISVFIVKEFHTWSLLRKLKILKKSYIFLLVNFLALGLAGVMFPSFFETVLFPSGSDSLIVYIFIAFAFVESLFEVSNSFLRAAQIFSTIALFNFLRSFTKFLSVAVFYSADTAGNLNPFLFLLLVEVFLLVGSTFQLVNSMVANSSNDSSSKEQSYELFSHQNIHFIFSYTLINLFYTLITLSDRYLILHLLGDDAFSEYLFYTILVSPIILIYTTINFVYSPHQAKMSHSHETVTSIVKSNTPNLDLFLMTSSYAVGIVLILSSTLVSIVGNERVIFDPVKFLLISASMLFFGIHNLLTFTLILGNQSRKLLLILIACAILSVVTNLLFMQSVGIYGPFLSGIIVNMILLLGTVVVINLKRANIRELFFTNVLKLGLRTAFFLGIYLVLSRVFVDNSIMRVALIFIWLTVLVLELRAFGKDFNPNES